MTTPTPAAAKPMGIVATIRLAHRTTWAQPLFYVLTVLVAEGLVVALVSPLLRLIYRLVLRETGLGSIAYDEITAVLRNPLADGTLLLALVVAVIVVLAGFAVLFILADHHQDDGSASIREVLRQLLGTLRKLAGPQGLLMAVYLMLLLPVSQFGLTATLTRRIGVPPFVAEELQKSPTGNLAYTAFVLVAFYLNLRLLLTVPVLATTSAGVWQAFTTSWRLTRWRSLKTVAMMAALAVPAAVVVLVLIFVTLVPTFVTDDSAPQYSPFAASIGLAMFQVLVFVVTALLAVMVAQCLVAVVRDGLPRLAAERRPILVPGIMPSEITPARRRLVWLATAVLVVGALVIGTVSNIGTMRSLASSPPTQVLAHRGWVAKGVENTIPALDGAKESGANRVEFDVQETRDGRFVVMHDANLNRLAGINRNVGEMTLAELTQVSVRSDGMTARIPSLEEWIEESKRLELPQLLEVKLHGGESADLIPRLLAVLDAHGVTDWYTYHSLDRGVVTELKRERPELVVGFIVPINFGGVPNVNCDFIVVEEQSYDKGFLDEAQGRGYKVLVWTVDDEDKMRTYMADGVDGIISDQPQLGVAEQQDFRADTGLHGRLLDRTLRLAGV